MIAFSPRLVFDRWLDHLPTIKRLLQNGMYGPLQSCIPPITVPAWACMMTGKDPGALGIYGFRNRLDHSYDGLTMVNSFSVKEERVWDILSRMGNRSSWSASLRPIRRSRSTDCS